MAFDVVAYALAKSTLSGVTSFTTKGSVDSYDDLPATSDVGDLYITTDTGSSYVWDGSQWVKLSKTTITDNGAGTVTISFGG